MDETTEHRRDADATGRPQFFNPSAEVARLHGANLPHWRQGGATYYVTFRLADSLPAQVLDAWRTARAELLAHAQADDEAAERRLRALFAERIEQHLDAGAGECLLARPGCARIVGEALRHFDGQRYRLWVWCVMPNHVHALVEPLAGHALPDILHSWKSYTAHAINALLGREGPVWQAESFDHLVRSANAFEAQHDYILANPERAGLADWAWRGTAVAQPVASASRR